MIYKICKYIERDHVLNNDTNLYELIEKEKFYIKRKGKIFGFWHTVGDWLCDIQGNSFCYDQRFDSYEQARSYLYCWHKETYGDNNIEII